MTKLFLSNRVCQCGAVVKELLARADKQGSTSGDAVFCFLYRFFFLFGLFFKNYFSFWPSFLKSFVLYEAYFFPFKLEAFIFLMIVKSLLYGY